MKSKTIRNADAAIAYVTGGTLTLVASEAFGIGAAVASLVLAALIATAVELVFRAATRR